ncbi:MAG: virulence RhuM family protein [Bacteroides sp.]|nr:virulence RhuM family protein [Bacteroides sp.]
MHGIKKVTRNIPYFNLDMIISVGYRVNSKRGNLFGIWANKVLKDYLVKGYAINNSLNFYTCALKIKHFTTVIKCHPILFLQRW